MVLVGLVLIIYLRLLFILLVGVHYFGLTWAWVCLDCLEFCWLLCDLSLDFRLIVVG